MHRHSDTRSVMGRRDWIHCSVYEIRSPLNCTGDFATAGISWLFSPQVCDKSFSSSGDLAESH